ncbi:MAG: protein kinase [Dysgonamonadaceae bacterium]|jgi:serine/threonine-protein kinase|nr:protein kinase [Dysgonamonadaceae bacterium]
MATKVILKVNKGSLKGKTFSYDMRESFVIGRANDCPVCFSDNTVSRYHCHIDINPPDVMVRDLGTLNGTMLNGKFIGQRDPSLSPEEAQKFTFDEFLMKPGDKLGLGTDCEMEIIIEEPVVKETFTCAACRCELDEIKYKNDAGLPICKTCYNRLEQIKRIKQIPKSPVKEPPAPKPDKVPVPKPDKAPAPKPNKAPAPKPDKPPVSEPQPKPLAEPQPQNDKCYVCRGILDEGSNGTNICSKCRKNPVNILQHLLHLAMQGKGEEVNIVGYRNVKSLGQGGMGQVWLVENEKTRERMALKVMLPDCARDERSIKIFLREAYTGCALKHTNVVNHHNFGRSGNIFFILMELCEGGSVDKLLETKGGSLGRSEQDMAIATSITLQVLDGLYFSHNALIPVVMSNNETEKRKGVVHRDFKPANIFIANTDLSRPIAKVADFGLAKSFDAAGLTSLSKGGGTCGTIVFMPRQQLRDSRYAKPDVDVWAAAASYYYMLTGQLVRDFRGRSTGELYKEVIYNSPVPVLKRNSRIPEKLAQVIDTALQEEPKIGVHKMIKEVYGKEPKDDHVEALVLKKKIWESLMPDFRRKVWDILPPFTKKSLTP